VASLAAAAVAAVLIDGYKHQDVPISANSCTHHVSRSSSPVVYIPLLAAYTCINFYVRSTYDAAAKMMFASSRPM